MFRSSFLLLFLLSGNVPPAPGAECGPKISGSEVLLRPGGLVILGEIHGTREAPKLFGDLVCRAAAKGIPVRAGLEIPVAEKAPMEKWFRGTGEKEKLWNSPFFAKDYQDGRSSRAMAMLLLRLRALHRQGKDVEPFFFDPGSSANRDHGMAERIAAVLEKNPQAAVLILTGNLHAQKAKGSPFSKTFVPLGYFLAEERFSPITIKLLTSRGTAWVCNGSTPDTCGVRGMGGKDFGEPPLLDLGEEGMPLGYDGTLFLGPATASEPFKDVEEESPDG